MRVREESISKGTRDSKAVREMVEFDKNFVQGKDSAWD